MTILFDRKVEVVVGRNGLSEARRFTEHRIDFQLDHQDGKQASSGEVSIWNMSRSQRAWIKDNAEVAILRCGYAGRIVDAFTGEIDRIEVDYRLPDIVTKFTLGDGIRATTTERIAVSWPTGLTFDAAIRRVAEQLGVSIAYIEPTPELQRQFLRPRAFEGLASDALEILSLEVGMEWTITDGQLYLVRPTSTRRDRAYVISASTGLVGTPELVIKSKKRAQKVTGIRFKTLLLPDLRPGHSVQLESREYRGAYKAERVTHSGGNGWDSSYYTDTEAKLL